MDELLKKVAELRGMPASLVERSAKAKAEKSGTTVEAVLAEWAGEAAEPAAEPEPPATEAPKPDATPAAKEKDTPVEDAPSAQREVTTDYLVQLAAEAKRMPAKLILSSANARSTHSGASLHDVLADWAGVDLAELEAEAGSASEEPQTPDAATPAPEPAADDAPRIPVTTVAAAAAPVVAAQAAGITMDELLEKVAEVKGMPASLAQRSAQARAKKTGEPVEAVLAEWAGVDPATISAAPAAAEAVPQTPPPAPPQETAPAAEDLAKDNDVEIIEAKETDTSDTSDTDEDLGQRRRGYPVWLAAAFVLIPLVAIAYLLISPNGPDCGSGGQLAVDPVTGVAMNCDGSAYGDTEVDHLDAGGSVYQQCVACHGGDGTGGVGPAFTGGAVLATFPAGSCTEHIEWITLGTAGWPEPTYGANGKTVGALGLMPEFGSSLSEEQIAQVALFERVQFGGEDLEEAELDCGLVEAETEEGVEAGAEG